MVFCADPENNEGLGAVLYYHPDQLTRVGKKYSKKNQNIFGGIEKLLYLCINKINNDMEKLRVKKSDFKSDLSFNEWCEKYNLGKGYIQPTQYFQGHKNWSMEPIGVAKYIHENPIERLFRVLKSRLKK